MRLARRRTADEQDKLGASWVELCGCCRGRDLLRRRARYAKRQRKASAARTCFFMLLNVLVWSYACGCQPHSVHVGSGGAPRKNCSGVKKRSPAFRANSVERVLGQPERKRDRQGTPHSGPCRRGLLRVRPHHPHSTTAHNLCTSRAVRSRTSGEQRSEHAPTAASPLERCSSAVHIAGAGLRYSSNSQHAKTRSGTLILRQTCGSFLRKSAARRGIGEA